MINVHSWTIFKRYILDTQLKICKIISDERKHVNLDKSKTYTFKSVGRVVKENFEDFLLEGESFDKPSHVRFFKKKKLMLLWPMSFLVLFQLASCKSKIFKYLLSEAMNDIQSYSSSLARDHGNWTSWGTNSSSNHGRIQI
jgi:hypothetical protein